jgi:hypothetical protein
VAVHPAFDAAFDAFAPVFLHGKPKERQVWAVEQMLLAAKASKHLGLKPASPFPARSRGHSLIRGHRVLQV